MRKLSCGVTLALLYGCATASPEYVPMTVKSPYGYKEILQQDQSYLLSVVLPVSPASESLSFEYWNRRAETLCGGTDYEKNIYKAMRPTLNPQTYYVQGGVSTGRGSAGAFTLEGSLTCPEGTPVYVEPETVDPDEDETSED